MEITDVRIFVKPGGEKRLRGYAVVTFDGVFVVRNIKIVEGPSGLFIAMPSRRIKAPCPACGHKNEAGARYCQQCGALQEAASGGAREAREEHRDIAHPVTQTFREHLQKKILDAYAAQTERGDAEGTAA